MSPKKGPWYLNAAYLQLTDCRENSLEVVIFQLATLIQTQTQSEAWDFIVKMICM